MFNYSFIKLICSQVNFYENHTSCTYKPFHCQGLKLKRCQRGSIKLFWVRVITVVTNVSFIGFMEPFPWSVHFSLYINLLDDQLPRTCAIITDWCKSMTIWQHTVPILWWVYLSAKDANCITSEKGIDQQKVSGHYCNAVCVYVHCYFRLTITHLHPHASVHLTSRFPSQ